jgi:hypothetical protein
MAGEAKIRIVDGSYRTFDQRVTDMVRRSGSRLTDEEASARVEEADRFVGAVTARLAELRLQRSELDAQIATPEPMPVDHSTEPEAEVGLSDHYHQSPNVAEA